MNSGVFLVESQQDWCVCYRSFNKDVSSGFPRSPMWLITEPHLGLLGPPEPVFCTGRLQSRACREGHRYEQTAVFLRVSHKKRWLQSSTTQYFFGSPYGKSYSMYFETCLVLLASHKNAVSNLKTEIGLCSLHIWKWNFYPSTSGMWP